MSVTGDGVLRHRPVTDVVLIIEGPTGRLCRHHHFFISKQCVPDTTCSHPFIKATTSIVAEWIDYRVVEEGRGGGERRLCHHGECQGGKEHENEDWSTGHLDKLMKVMRLLLFVCLILYFCEIFYCCFCPSFRMKTWGVKEVEKDGWNVKVKWRRNKVKKLIVETWKIVSGGDFLG